MIKKLGFIFILFSLIGMSWSYGFHYPYEVWPGTFQGDYSFNGSVGIGTSSPESIFHISGYKSATIITLENKDTTPGTGEFLGELQFKQNDISDVGVSSKIVSVSEGTSSEAGLSFYTGTPSTISEKLRIGNNGNVGIGTSSPQTKLQIKSDINQNIRIGTLGSYASIHTYNDASNAYVPFRIDANPLILNHYSGNNVGIGTTNPQELLEVRRDTIDNTTLGVYNSNGDANAKAMISVGYDPGYGMDIYRVGNSADIFFDATQGSGKIRFQDSGVDTLTIDEVGDVGIGTTNPLVNLHINSESVSLGEHIQMASSEGGSYNIVLGYDANGATHTAGILRSKNNLPLKLGTTATPDALFITNSKGRVGIGTVAPISKLDVTFADEGNIAYDSGISLNYPNGYPSDYGFLVNFEAYISEHRDLIRLRSGGVNRFLVQADGNVGIGIDSPGYKLDIKADSVNQKLLRLSHSTSPTAAGFMIGFNTDGTTDENVISMSVEYSGTDYDVINIKRSTRMVGIGITNPNVALDVLGSIEYTGTIADVSDIRLKENIEPIINPTQKLQQINGFYFDMINRSLSNITELGVSAQDVEIVLPELVFENDEGFKSVNYIGLIPVLIESNKELKQENDNLKQVMCDNNLTADFCN